MVANANCNRKKPAWADEVDDELPAPEIINNPDGTKTVISYRINPENNKKVRITQKVREVKKTERVDHSVAERKKWAKYGAEKNSAAGPNVTTTSVEPDFTFKLGLKPTKAEEEAEAAAKAVAEPAPEAKIACRICSGSHFTSRCPYKDTLGPADAAGADKTKEAATAAPAAAPAGKSGSSYVPPHLRAGARPSERVTSNHGERDDSTTLRVSNLSEDVTEDELRRLFSYCGRVVRCHLVRDRDTGRNRGFAFVCYETRSEAEKACEKLNGYGLDNLIMRVEFSKK